MSEYNNSSSSRYRSHHSSSSHGHSSSHQSSSRTQYSSSYHPSRPSGGSSSHRPQSQSSSSAYALPSYHHSSSHASSHAAPAPAPRYSTNAPQSTAPNESSRYGSSGGDRGGHHRSNSDHNNHHQSSTSSSRHTYSAAPHHALALPPPPPTSSAVAASASNLLAPSAYSSVHRGVSGSHFQARYHPYNDPRSNNNGYPTQSHSQSSLMPSRMPSRASHSHMSSHARKSKKTRTARNEFGIPLGTPGSTLSAPDWSSIELSRFQKNFYRESSEVTAMSSASILEWRKVNNVRVRGDNVPRPILKFSQAGFPPYILTEIARAGFVAPTPIQCQGWPMSMSGRDVVGIAETGSGKTLAFLLPCIVHINAQPLLREGDGPIVLVIAPTRELAVQIEGEAAKFAYSSRIKHCCVYGGVSRRWQAHTLQRGVEIVICTPGRLLDFLEDRRVSLQRVTYLVIDEADRLLDMGFTAQLNSILCQVRPDRQILMWSATWPKEVEELSKKYIADSLQVIIGQFGDGPKANHNVLQEIVVLGDNEKYSNLQAILREKGQTCKILCFTATKKQADHLYLSHSGSYNCCVIHGDKHQTERDFALKQFKQNSKNIMFATDVASRGLHVDDINIVINYDFPNNLEDYVHRIGRTGRCGKKGKAISFFTKSDAKRADKLIRILKEANQKIPNKLAQLLRY